MADNITNQILENRVDKESARGRIDTLYRYPEKKALFIEESMLVLKVNHGIEGDCHADGGERQISLLTQEEKRWMDEQEIKGFCFKKYKPNILLDGLCLQKCKSGDVLICGDAVLEMTGSIKSCHPELCRLASIEKKCILAGSARFAKVIKDGTIQKGMELFCYEKNGDEL